MSENDKMNDSSYYVQKPLDLRGSFPSAKPRGDETNIKRENTIIPLSSTSLSEYKISENTSTFQTEDTYVESKCEKNCERDVSYINVARHPLKRRRIAFLSQMGDFDSQNRPNEIEGIISTTGTESELINQVKTIKTPPLKTSSSDTRLSLSWTKGSNNLKTYDHRLLCKKDNSSQRVPVSSAELEDSDFTKAKEFSLGDLMKSHGDGKRKWTFGQTHSIPIDKQERNVSNNCILEYIKRCRITKNPLPSNKERKYWNYSDFQDLHLPRFSHLQDAGEPPSVKMSALDFLLSNFLMGKEDESFTPRNENANQVFEGKKKGTLSLMDVIELQVEMGLA